MATVSGFPIQETGRFAGLPNLTDPTIKGIFGNNIEGLLKGGELLSPMNERLSRLFAQRAGQTSDRFFVYRVCAGTTQLTPLMVRAAADVFRREVLWFFKRHTNKEFTQKAGRQDTNEAALRQKNLQKLAQTLASEDKKVLRKRHSALPQTHEQVAHLKANESTRVKPSIIETITKELVRDQQAATSQERLELEMMLARRKELLRERDVILQMQQEMDRKVAEINRDLSAVAAYFKAKGSEPRQRNC